MSQCSRRVIALLVETGIEYQEKPVDLMAGIQYSPEYLAMNPNHSVPVLVDGKVCINESNAILRYLCNKYDLENWYPKGASARAEVDQWLDWSATRLGPVTRDIVFNTLFAGENSVQHELQAGHALVPELSGILEGQLGKASYLAGNRPTIADLSVSASLFQLGLAELVFDGENTSSWYEKVSQMEGFRASLPPPMA
jgi:glutathione S-transferase|tara:strand:- start:1792 stop:2382 length:591 start_codon:yes stop_codon:yes gene_type:complete